MKKRNGSLTLRETQAPSFPKCLIAKIRKSKKLKTLGLVTTQVYLAKQLALLMPMIRLPTSQALGRAPPPTNSIVQLTGLTTGETRLQLPSQSRLIRKTLGQGLTSLTRRKEMTSRVDCWWKRRCTFHLEAWIRETAIR